MLECMVVDDGLVVLRCLALASAEVRSSRRERLRQVDGRLPQQRTSMPNRDANKVDGAPVSPELF